MAHSIGNKLSINYAGLISSILVKWSAKSEFCPSTSVYLYKYDIHTYLNYLRKTAATTYIINKWFLGAELF